jgi:RNA polymerase sigma factor (sigma-70 family)
MTTCGEVVIAEDIASHTSHEAEQTQNARYLAGLLARLSDEEADIVTLRAIEEMSYLDIAHIVGKTEDAVRKTYSRSLEKLRVLVTDTL